jgi:ubiquinone/menaquinone biosynthesis C-methylase UbiE
LHLLATGILRNADAAALPFRPGAFQFILCSEVLEHLKDDGSAVQEFARVLARNGYDYRSLAGLLKANGLCATLCALE